MRLLQCSGGCVYPFTYKVGYVFYYFLHSAVTGGRAGWPYGAAAPSVHIGLQNHEAHHMPGVWKGSVNSPQVSSTKEF